MGVYEIDGRVYEMAPSEEQMLLQRHRRPTADVEPVHGSLLRDLEQTLVAQYLASARETSMLRPQPTMVGWGLGVASDRA